MCVRASACTRQWRAPTPDPVSVYWLAGASVQVLGQIMAGKRLRHPAGCPDAVYDVMQRCWSATPELRPAFNGGEGLVAILSNL